MIAETQRKEVERYRRTLKRSWAGLAWHGPSLEQALEGVTPEIAARTPAAGEHSIWELTRHIALWTRVVLETIEGTPYPTLEPPADWPKPSGSSSDAVVELEREETALITALKTFPDSRLDEMVTERKGYTFAVMVEGLIEHNAYHSGQIVILRSR